MNISDQIVRLAIRLRQMEVLEVTVISGENSWKRRVSGNHISNNDIASREIKAMSVGSGSSDDAEFLGKAIVREVLNDVGDLVRTARDVEAIEI